MTASPLETDTETARGPEIDELADYLARYHADDLAAVAAGEEPALRLPFSSLLSFDADAAEWLLDAPDMGLERLSVAAGKVDLPSSSLKKPTVRVVDLPDQETHAPGELGTDDVGRLVAIRGRLDRITEPTDHPLEAHFLCRRCGTTTTVVVGEDGDPDDIEPHECRGCERSGPFELKTREGEWEKAATLRLEAPPSSSPAQTRPTLDATVRDEQLLDRGGEHGLVGRASEEIVAIGVLDRRERRGRTASGYTEVLRVRAVEFPDDDQSVDIDEHREAFEELAERDDAVDLLAQSIAPRLHATDEWEAAFEAGVAFLFGAPEINHEAATIRGDIHMLIVSDHGMGKSVFNRGVEELSPDAARRSATGLSSDAGLLAAAQRDDFGGGDSWTIVPGLLSRAAGGHLVLDEIDKPDIDAEKMNDALEAPQEATVDKAGQQARFSTNCGFLATGNPRDGRFDPHEPIAPQLDLDPSFLDRFDVIITMEDRPERDKDRAVAETVFDGVREAQEAAAGDREEFDALDRPVDPAVARAWIAYAREKITPRLQPGQREQVAAWYAEEIRQLNGDGDEDLPAPSTAREIEAALRLATAFARCRLREEVGADDIDRACSLIQRILGQTVDDGVFDPKMLRGIESLSQKERREGIVEALTDADDAMTAAEIADQIGADESTVRDDLATLSKQGRVYQPSRDGGYRPT